MTPEGTTAAEEHNPLKAKPPVSWRDYLSLARFTFMTHPQAHSALWGMGILNKLIPPAQAWIAKLIIDRILLAVNTGESLEVAFRAILFFLLLELGLLLASEIFSYGDRLLTQITDRTYEEKMNTRIYKKLLSLDLSYFENPDFTSRYDYHRYRFQHLPTQVYGRLKGLVLDLWGFLLFIPLLLQYEILIVLLAGIAPLILVLYNYFENLRFRALNEAGWRENWENREVEFIIRQADYAKEVRAFNLGNWLLAQIKKGFQIDRAYQLKKNRLDLISRIVTFLAQNTFYYLAYGISILRVLQGRISLGDLTLLMQSYRTLRSEFESMLRYISNLTQDREDICEFNWFLGLKSHLPSEGKPPLPKRDFKSIRFDQVGFRYPGTAANSLTDISLEIRKGEHIALVGENGSGKTTLTKLLLRLHDPTEGKILWNDTPITEFDDNSWRALFGVIFQDWQKYDLSVAQNIQISEPDRQDRTAMEEAARLSGAAKFIADFPDGYDSALGKRFRAENDGLQLSQGQWQKIALARAFYRNAPILVLDEPTAAVDPRAEYELYRHFKDKREDRTLILISHRFSSVRFADRIIVLDKGRIAEQGTHAELLKLNGLYAEMYRMQMEGLQEK